MNAIYTSCTINHFSRALSLHDSVQEKHPGLRFFICLVDTVDKSLIPEGDFEIVFAEDMQLPFLMEMCIKYSTLELTSALKPYFGKFLLGRHTQLTKLIYLDSDILLFNTFDAVFELLDKYSIIITPHSQSSLDSGFVFDDRDFLRSGIYNAGFFALKTNENSVKFLEWWMLKLKDQGFFDPRKGMFAEQLWMNLIPLYFKDVLVLLHKGYNVAYWNLHERIVSKKDGQFWVNNEVPLVFFHFSGADANCFLKNNPSRTQDRYTFSNRPDIIPVFESYVANLNKFALPEFDKIYTITGKLNTRSETLRKAIEIGRKVIKRIFFLK